MPSGRKKNVLKVKARGSHVRVTNLNQAGNVWFSFLIDKDDWEALQWCLLRLAEAPLTGSRTRDRSLGCSELR